MTAEATVSTDYRPDMRDDLAFTWTDEKTLDAIIDPLLDHFMKLGPVTRALVQRIDGTRTVEEVIGEVRALLPETPRAEVENAFRNLFLANLVEGVGEPVLELARQLKAGKLTMKPVMLPGQRFECQGSGQCCQTYEYGPLRDEDVDRLAKLDIAGVYPKLGPGPYVETHKSEQTGANEWYLKKVEGRCIFLLNDMRCGVHAAFGAQAKPAICRLFPWRSLFTLEGVRIYDQSECATFAVSARKGDSLEKQLEWIEPLLDKTVRLFHPMLLLDARTMCDYGYFARVQDALCAAIDRRIGDPVETVGAIGGFLRAFVLAMKECPLRPDEPRASLERVLARDPASFIPPRDAVAPREALLAVVKYSQALVGAMREGFMSRQFGEVTKLIGALAAERAGASTEPCPGIVPAIAAVPVDDPEIEEVMRLSFRNYIWSDASLVYDRPVAGLARFAFTYIFTMFGARLQAKAQGAPSVSAVHLSFPHRVANVMLRQPYLHDVLVSNEGLAWDLVAAVPAMVR